MVASSKKSLKEFSPGGVLSESESPPPSFLHAQDDAEFQKAYRRFPRHDLAEAVIALRHLRGFTQAELALRMGTKQPAIARIESARSNVGLDTVRQLSIALDAVIQISMRPSEDLRPSQRND